MIQEIVDEMVNEAIKVIRTKLNTDSSHISNKKLLVAIKSGNCDQSIIDTFNEMVNVESYNKIIKILKDKKV